MFTHPLRMYSLYFVIMFMHTSRIYFSERYFSLWKRTSLTDNKTLNFFNIFANIKSDVDQNNYIYLENRIHKWPT